jgi:hypothetical protein
MLDGAPRRLLLTSFPSLVGGLLVGSLLVDSLLVGSLLVPVVPRSGPAVEQEALGFARAGEASGVECDDPATPCDDRDPGEPAEEIGPESAESDPAPAVTAATPMDARLRLCAGVSPARAGAPRQGDSLRRLTVTSTERGPPRVA